MTFGEEEKDDATFNQDLTALLDKAREDGIPYVYLLSVVAAFYRRHGREVPSPVVEPPPPPQPTE